MMEESVTKLVEGVSEKIIVCAKEEFLQKGYSDASLRTIAAKAGTTTGSIYSRFKDKEGLFCAIVVPVVDGLVDIFTETQKEFHAIDAEKQSEIVGQYSEDGMMNMIDYVYDHFEEFELLLNASYGTKYHDFVEQLVDIETEYTYKFMETIGFKESDDQVVTEEIIHIMARTLFEGMFEVVRHNMSKEKAVMYISMLEKYHHAGWDTVFKFD